MADFRTHLTTSALLGAAYGTASHLSYDIPLPPAVLAGGLVTIGGVLPDVDSDNAIVLRESLALVAAVAPMMMLHHYREWGWTNETIVLVSAAAYLTIRFGLGNLLRSQTVHRGMWHSVPAAAIAGLLVYLLCSCTDMQSRMCKTGGIVTGYLWHLVLDEINSVESTDRGRVRIKRSFGTALKLFGNSLAANVWTYGKLIVLAVVAMTLGPNPLWDMHSVQGADPQMTSQPAVIDRPNPTDARPYRQPSPPTSFPPMHIYEQPIR